MLKKIQFVDIKPDVLEQRYKEGLKEFNGVKLKPAYTFYDTDLWLPKNVNISTYQQYIADLKAYNKKVDDLIFKILYWLTIIVFVGAYALSYYYFIDEFRISTSLMLFVGLIFAFLIVEKIIVNLGLIIEAIVNLTILAIIIAVLYNTVWVWLVKYW